MTVTTNDIINSALRKIGEFDQAEAIPGPDYQNALLAFELLVKELVARGADLFTRKRITLFIQKGQEQYSLGATSTDHYAESVVETTLGAAASASATQLTVDESLFSVSDNIGVKLQDGSTHWSTVVSLSPLTILDALPSDASIAAKVYGYTTRAGRPQKLLTAFRRDPFGQDVPVDLIGEREYFNLSDKNTSGPVNQLWYLPSTPLGSLNVWPAGDGATDKLVMSAQFFPEEIPPEWGTTLIFGLAAEMAPEYGVPLQERAFLRQVAEEKREELLAYDTENAPVIFGMDGRRW